MKDINASRRALLTGSAFAAAEVLLVRATAGLVPVTGMFVAGSSEAAECAVFCEERHLVEKTCSDYLCQSNSCIGLACPQFGCSQNHCNPVSACGVENYICVEVSPVKAGAQLTPDQAVRLRELIAESELLE